MLIDQSTVYMIQSSNITNIRLSVARNVWSSKEGANKVYQNAWEKRIGEQKIMFLFSVTHRYVLKALAIHSSIAPYEVDSHKHKGKFVGMAEMAGPYDPTADPRFCNEKKEGVKGAIPVRWIVAKDVPFSAFNELEYRGKPITQLRHANT